MKYWNETQRACFSNLRVIAPQLALINGATGTERQHALLQIVQRAFDESSIVLEMTEQASPQPLLSQHGSVANHDDAVAGSSKRNVQAPRVD